MGIKRNIMAFLLATTMIVSSAVPTMAKIQSPTKAQTTENKGYKNNLDYNSQDHVSKTVISKVTSPKKVVTSKVTTKSKGKSTGVVISYARDKKNKKVQITQIGTGKAGVFDSKSGRKLDHVRVASTAKKVIIAKKAFYNSNIKTIRLQSKKVQINKNAFYKTKAKTVKIKIIGSKRKASAFTFQKGAFNGLSKKSTVIVRKGTMTAKEFKKLKKNLQKAGFKGTIKRA